MCFDAAPLPVAAPAGAGNRSRIVTKTFRNPAPVDLPIAGAFPVSAELYPSKISVKGLKGRIRDVNVRLNNFTHAWPGDVEMLLVGPRGQTTIVVANRGGAMMTTA